MAQYGDVLMVKGTVKEVGSNYVSVLTKYGIGFTLIKEVPETEDFEEACREMGRLYPRDTTASISGIILSYIHNPEWNGRLHYFLVEEI